MDFAIQNQVRQVVDILVEVIRVCELYSLAVPFLISSGRL
jgi:hypothetical protein